jgi:hypothetical protein
MSTEREIKVKWLVLVGAEDNGIDRGGRFYCRSSRSFGDLQDDEDGRSPLSGRHDPECFPRSVNGVVASWSCLFLYMEMNGC